LSEPSVKVLHKASLLAASVADETSNEIQVSFLTQLLPVTYVHFSELAALGIPSQYFFFSADVDNDDGTKNAEHALAVL